MIKSFKVRSLVMSCVLMVCAALYSACGIGSAVRPDDPTANQAVGEAFECSPEKLKGTLSPFTVDWSDGDRVALESEMADGVALIKFSCEGVEVLRGCDIAGDYNYKGISKKTKLVSMSDMGAVRANIGGTVNLPSEFKAEMSQGSALNLAYVLVGAQNTTVRNVMRGRIKADHCKGATHFVYEAQIGAFALDTSAKGEVKAAADVLGYGSVSGEAGSQKTSRVTDGDPKACEEATSKDRQTVEGCQALMRLSLLPVVEGGSLGPVASAASDTSGGDTSGGDTSGGDTSGGDTSGGDPSDENKELDIDLSTLDVRGCPDGFVYADGFCQYAAQATAYLCDEGDFDGCRTQCGNGSAESCGRFADLLLEKHFKQSKYMFACADGLTAFLAETEPFKAKFDEACDVFEAPACTMSALLLDLDFARQEDCTGEPGDAYAEQFISKMGIACMGREQRACQVVADAYGDGDLSSKGIPASAEMLDLILGGACEMGNARACWLIGELYYFASSGGVQRDIQKSLNYLARACLGDNEMACAFAGVGYNSPTSDKCTSQLQKVLPHIDDSFILYADAEPEEISTFCQEVSTQTDSARATDLLTNACKGSSQLASATCDLGIASIDLDLNLEGLDIE